MSCLPHAAQKHGKSPLRSARHALMQSFLSFYLPASAANEIAQQPRLPWHMKMSPMSPLEQKL